MSENLQEKQPQNNKKWLYICLVVVAWLVFVVGLMFASSKCARAGHFYTSNNVDTGITYDEGQLLTNRTYNIGSDHPSYIISDGPNTGQFMLVFWSKQTLSTPNYLYLIYGYQCTWTPTSTGGTLYCGGGLLDHGTGLGTNYRTFTVGYNSTYQRYEILWYGRFDNGASNYFYPTPSSSGGYTQEDLDNAYADGQLDALNDASSSTYGSGTTYTSYTSSAMHSEVNNAYLDGVSYADGRVNTSSASYTAGYTAGETSTSAYQDGYTAGYDIGYTAGYNDGVDNVLARPGFYGLRTEQQYLAYGVSKYNDGYSDGELYVLNEVSSSQYGSGQVYTYYDSFYLNQELLSVGYENWLIGRDSGRLELLNYASGHNGSGLVYGSYTSTDYDNELALIYSNGADAGADQSYSGGYTAGVNSVLDNLTYYDLYSKNDYDSAVLSARSSGYSLGYQQGKLDYEDVDVSLPHTITAIASVPLTVLTSMFNFEVLGLNLFAFITSILTLLIVIWVIKKLMKK